MTQKESSALPPAEVQLALLRTTGDQFDDTKRSLEPLAGIRMPSDGEPALYDTRIIPAIPQMIVPSERVCEALAAVRPGQLTANYAVPDMAGWFDGEGIIVGFSGYGTGGGYDYSVEQSGIEAVLDHCAQIDLPVDGVTDGATGYGIPGLSGLIASERGLSTLGFTPLRGLRGAAMRHTCTVVGEEFGDEAAALGAAPDVLIALGGGPIAEKEVATAVKLGSFVILGNINNYRSTSAVHLAERDPDAQQARAADKLVVHTTISGMKAALDTVRENLPFIRGSRPDRFAYLSAVLAARSGFATS